MTHLSSIEVFPSLCHDDPFQQMLGLPNEEKNVQNIKMPIRVSNTHTFSL